MMPCVYEQGSRKAEAVCIGPALRKVTQRVPSWPRPHRQHSRTGQSSPQLQNGCAFDLLQEFELVVIIFIKIKKGLFQFLLGMCVK